MPWQKYEQWIDDNNWREDERATIFANELLNNEEIELDAGVRMIKLSTWFQDDARASPMLFTRHHSRALWEDVYQYLSSRIVSHSLVTGNPGIGKSRSMTYLLRLLLKDGKLVVFESRKDEQFFAFIPPSKHGQGNNYKVWVAKSSTFAFPCPALLDAENYYLIDPGQVPKGPSTVAAHTVLAASPNRAHYHEFLKSPGSNRFLMPIWNEAELQAIREHMPVDEQHLSETDVRERFFKFGGIPRYVYASQQQLTNVVDPLFYDALEGLRFDQLVKAMTGGATIELNQKNMDRIPSILFQYVFVDDDRGKKQSYGMSIDRYRLHIASDYVANMIYMKYWKEVQEMMDPKSLLYSGSASLGRFFEFVATRSVSNGGVFKVRELLSDNQMAPITTTTICETSKIIHADNSRSGLYEVASKLNYCAKIAASNDRIVAIPGATNQPVIDMMDAKDRAFQFTISNTHSIKPELETMMTSIGITKLCLYFVVPPSRFEQFHIPSKKIEGMEKQRSTVLCFGMEHGSLRQEMIVAYFDSNYFGCAYHFQSCAA